MENAKKRWNLAIHFLTPEEVAQAYSEIIHPVYGKRHNYEDLIKRTDIFNTNYFGIPEDKEERKAHFINHAINFLTPELMISIYQSAYKIRNATQRGDRIVIFGNTPVFVGRALSHLISSNREDENYRQLLLFPFSGSPNRVRQRNFLEVRDWVTKERHEHLKARMALLGLSSDHDELLKGTTHFVDVIASGSGIAYVIEDILRDFKQAEKPYPNLNVLTLNEIDIDNKEDSRNASVVDRTAKDEESLMFSFPSQEDTHFRVTGKVTHLPGYGFLDMLPSDDYCIFPQYNALYWQPCFDEFLT